MERYNAKKTEMCVCNNCENIEDMGLECITSSMLQTREGQKLLKQTRWGNFRWENRERFEHFIGPDANNFWHGPHQAKEIAIPFIEMQNSYGNTKISEEEARLLVILNVVHDIQEAVTGDMALPDKTKDSNRRELEIQAEILARVFDVNQHHPFLQRLQAVQSGSSFLGEAFTAIEYAGYFHTGIRAWALKDHEGLEPDERHKSYLLGRAVLTQNTPEMYAMADAFPYMGHLLRLNDLAIKEANAQ